MAMAPDSSRSSKPLHNFALPPFLKWGAQRILPCKKLDAVEVDVVADAAAGDQQRRSDRIEAIGEKLMLDYRLAMEKVKVVGTADVGEKEKGESSRPWNLRTRRSPAPVPAVENKKKGASPVKRLRGVSEEKGKEEKVEFRVALRKEEIEEDFMMIAGIKPARRPKKRPRAVQKELDTLFPGLWLTEVTTQRYDVPEATEQ